MHIIQNNTSGQPSSQKGCLKRFLIIFGIGFALFVGGGWFLYDQISGNAAKRFEDKENKKLAKEILPEEYKSYPELSELQSTDKYDVIPLGSEYTLHYILPDNTLVLADEFGGDFLRINPKGEIIDHYKNPGLKFYGTSLMQYTISTSPEIVFEGDEISGIVKPEAIISGTYSHWPVNGDTTLFAIQPIEKISANRKEKAEAYNKADVVMSEYLPDNKVEQYYFLYINNVWYISDYDYGKNVKEIYTRRENYFRELTSFRNITINYKKRNYYERQRSAGYLSGGVLNFDQWKGDIYLSMKVGKTRVLFKTNFEEHKDDGDIRVNFDVLNMGNYVIIRDCMIRMKNKTK